MFNIYVIYGESGEYSELVWWMVEAVYTEEEAQQRVLELEALISELFHSLDQERNVALHESFEKNDETRWQEYWRTVDERKQIMREHPKGDPHLQIVPGEADARYAYQMVPIGE